VKRPSPEEQLAAAKARAEAAAVAEAAARARTESEMMNVARWSRWQDEGYPTKANPMGFLPLPNGPVGPPSPLAEGTPPSELGIVTQSLQKMKRDLELIERDREWTRRLQEEQFEFVPAVADTPTREEARLALGRALENGVTSGLLSEERALAMIAVGQINNTPLTTAEARTHLRAAVSQAVAAGGLLIATARTIMDLLEDAVPINEDPPLLERIALLEDQVYQALLIRPCHKIEHAGLHRFQVMPCATQFSWLGQALLSGRGLGLPPNGLPRMAHLREDGTREACCDDERIDTWLVYGQTQEPSDRYDGRGEEDGPDASDGDD
jgi:hypothetical protein